MSPLLFGWLMARSVNCGRRPVGSACGQRRKLSGPLRSETTRIDALFAKDHQGLAEFLARERGKGKG
jgi:hypothetical protein